MHRTSAVVLAGLTVSLAPCAATASASAAPLAGIVVHSNARAHSFVLANGRGHLIEVHVRHAPTAGRRVTVTAHRLANGTWKASRIREAGSARFARLHGTVTFVNHRAGEFVVSARGVSLLVRDGGRRNSARMSAALPSLGSVVTVGAKLTPGGDVSASRVTEDGKDTNGVDLEGTVLAIDSTAHTLTLSADDSGQSGATLTIDVPATFDMSFYSVGGRLEAIATLNPDGTYTLVQSSGDSSAQQAGDNGAQQGDGSGDSQSSTAIATCTAQQSDPNFAATHNSETFVQYYSENPSQPNANDAFGRCVDQSTPSSDHSGGDGSGSGSGKSGDGSGSGSDSGSGKSGDGSGVGSGDSGSSSGH